MMNPHPLQKLVGDHKNGSSQGICSICSANEYVIGAALHRASLSDAYVLIESTANQVDQFGGYTGMKPADFRNFVHGIAEKQCFPLERVLLGGDHLGPLTWKSELNEDAMLNAEELVRQYASAGFSKIHLDTSMHLGENRKDRPLDPLVMAQRAARLCQVAEESWRAAEESVRGAEESVRGAEEPVRGVDESGRVASKGSPVYVIGSEVPIPGGNHEEEEDLQITKPEDFNKTVEVFEQVFHEKGLSSAWERVIAVVVQPGVEFGDESVHAYDRNKARNLSAQLKKYPRLVFEGHSTDYQTPSCLRQMVEDGIAILKVGPQLTFALREALFSLNLMEMALFSGTGQVEPSRFMNILEEAMLRNPDYWKNHYHGSEAKQKFARKYSFSDRCRYYLPDPVVQASLQRLLANLRSIPIPLSLISQFMRIQYGKIRNGNLLNDPEAMLTDSIVNVLDAYYSACGLQ
jgi:D-tagatose-1,6-bisphosphate aldolase subunit GatZ/KbaZ